MLESAIQVANESERNRPSDFCLSVRATAEADESEKLMATESMFTKQLPCVRAQVDIEPGMSKFHTELSKRRCFCVASESSCQ